MIHTVKFRIYPDLKQENKLNEILTIYNRVKSIGYKLLFHGEDYMTERFGEVKTIQQCLMSLCQNNPYVNTILINNKAKLEAQKTWLEKRRKHMAQQLQVITKKINAIKEQNTNDRRLNGLYARRSSIMAKHYNLHFEPAIFGTKQLFRKRICGDISREEFRIRRDSSFSCVGVKANAQKTGILKYYLKKTSSYVLFLSKRDVNG